jgi:cytoplasmic iron level regulating protein YaaA (DUF328/UPF0246 family)
MKVKDLLVIIPCGQGKIWDEDPNREPTPAREAYTGVPFKINRAYAEHFTDHWVILSAKYGFIPPDFTIPGPYNVTFKRKSTNPVKIATLQEQIRAQALSSFDKIICLGGKEYRSIVCDAFADFGKEIIYPFAGLPMGKAMQATKRATQADEPFYFFKDRNGQEVGEEA